VQFFDDFEQKDYSILYVLARLFNNYGFVGLGLCQAWNYGFGEQEKPQSRFPQTPKRWQSSGGDPRRW